MLCRLNSKSAPSFCHVWLLRLSLIHTKVCQIIFEHPLRWHQYNTQFHDPRCFRELYLSVHMQECFAMQMVMKKERVCLKIYFSIMKRRVFFWDAGRFDQGLQFASSSSKKFAVQIYALVRSVRCGGSKCLSLHAKIVFFRHQVLGSVFFDFHLFPNYISSGLNASLK